MNFNIDSALHILTRTPGVVRAMLENLPDEWTAPNEGPDTWSPYDIVGHLIHGEKTDWIPHMHIILTDAVDRKFVPFDRFAQFEDSKGKSLSQLLDEFEMLRKQAVNELKIRTLTEHDLDRTGIHPAFGEVTLRQLLSTWVVHDLNHIGQIARVMAKQYKEEVGPWVAYLGILCK